MNCDKNTRTGIWVQCWNTDHEEHILVWPNELSELNVSEKLSLRAGRKHYWFNGSYAEFRQFLVGRSFWDDLRSRK